MTGTVPRLQGLSPYRVGGRFSAMSDRRIIDSGTRRMAVSRSQQATALSSEPMRALRRASMTMARVASFAPPRNGAARRRYPRGQCRPNVHRVLDCLRRALTGVRRASGAPHRPAASRGRVPRPTVRDRTTVHAHVLGRVAATMARMARESAESRRRVSSPSGSVHSRWVRHSRRSTGLALGTEVNGLTVDAAVGPGGAILFQVQSGERQQ